MQYCNKSQQLITRREDSTCLPGQNALQSQRHHWHEERRKRSTETGPGSSDRSAGSSSLIHITCRSVFEGWTARLCMGSLAWQCGFCGLAGLFSPHSRTLRCKSIGSSCAFRSPLHNPSLVYDDYTCGLQTSQFRFIHS